MAVIFDLQNLLKPQKCPAWLDFYQERPFCPKNESTKLAKKNIKHCNADVYKIVFGAAKNIAIPLWVLFKSFQGVQMLARSGRTLPRKNLRSAARPH